MTGLTGLTGCRKPEAIRVQASRVKNPVNPVHPVKSAAKAAISSLLLAHEMLRGRSSTKGGLGGRGLLRYGLRQLLLVK